MTTAEKGTFYQHRYGGIYRVVEPLTLNTIDKSEWVVYQHIYPFEEQIWCRPKKEWEDGRFKSLTPSELREQCNKDRDMFQKEIAANKLAAKN